ncbi:hypothetical protein HY388_02625 [Candidatus Daviesbacteria bacterium]|nr:hypothetical protein [Candidatus Daviesbacteria bacterium]
MRPNPKNFQKGLLLRSFLTEGGQAGLILVGLVAMILGVAGTFVWQQVSRQVAMPKPASSAVPTPTTIPNPTANPDSIPIKSGSIGADWKTYTNTKLGYSLKYPPNWENDLDHGPGSSLHPPLPNESPGGGVDYLFSGISVYEINKEYNPEGLSFEEYVEKDRVQGEGVSRTVKKLSIDSLEGLEVTQFWEDLSQSYPFKSAYIKHNSKIYTIRLEQNGSFPEVRIHVNTFDQILSTFKFE